MRRQRISQNEAVQLSFPIKTEFSEGSFREYLRENGVIQPSILFKSHVLEFAFNGEIEKLNNFLEQIKSSYAYNRMTDPLRKLAYVSKVLFREIEMVEDSLKTDNLGVERQNVKILN